MSVIPVAVEYIELHRGDSTDEDIARALREQGFSDETLTEAFRAAGARPPGSFEPARLPPGKRALVAVLVALAALSFIASAVLFVRNFRQASAAAQAQSPR